MNVEARFLHEGRVNLRQSSGQGAAKYVAPETCGESPFTTTSTNIHSLGIIFFELFYRMVYASEAVRVITSLKSHKILPRGWSHPEHEGILLAMTAIDPDRHPYLITVRYLLDGNGSAQVIIYSFSVFIFWHFSIKLANNLWLIHLAACFYPQQ